MDAVEIPEVDAFSERFAPLALEVFPHVILDRFDHPGRLMTRRVERKYLLHVARLCPPGADLSSGERCGGDLSGGADASAFDLAAINRHAPRQ